MYMYQKYFDRKKPSGIRYRLLVPAGLRKRVLEETHDGLCGGHPGEEKTFQKLNSHTIGLHAIGIRSEIGAERVLHVPATIPQRLRTRLPFRVLLLAHPDCLILGRPK